MKTTRRPLLLPIKQPSGLPAYARELERDMLAIERSPIRRVVPVTPTVTKHVTAQTPAPSPVTGNGILFLAEDNDSFYYLYRYSNGVWSAAEQLTTIDASGNRATTLQKTAGKHFILSNTSVLYVSEDAGLTWVTAMSGLPDLNMGFAALSLDGISNTLYVFRYGTTAGHYEIYKSTNGAASWSLVQDITDIDYRGAETLQFAVNPFDAENVLFLGTNNHVTPSLRRTQMTIGYSTDGLSSYTKVAVVPSTLTEVGNLFEYQLMRFIPNSSRIVMMADVLMRTGTPNFSFGAYRSDNGGATWVEVINPMEAGKGEFGGSDPELGPLLAHDNGLMFACGNMANNLAGGGIVGVWVSQDNGETWTELPSVPTDWDTNPMPENAGGRIIYDQSANVLYAWNGYSNSQIVLKMTNPTGVSPLWEDITPPGVDGSTRYPAFAQALALA